MSHKQCRACLDDFRDTIRGDFKLYKLEEKCENGVTYLEVLKECTQLEALGSEHICVKCSDELSKFYIFLKKTRAVDVVWRGNISNTKQLYQDPLEESNNNGAEISHENLSLHEMQQSNLDELHDHCESNIFKTGDQIFVQGNFNCHICGMTYFTSVGLETHMEVHLPNRKRIRSLKKNSADVDTTHNKIRLQESNEHTMQSRAGMSLKVKKIYPCEECGKDFLCASKLRSHAVMHTGEKNFLCNVCPKIYSTVYALNHHMRSHTGERPYECTICGNKFFRPTTLKSHMRRHTGERPYSCQQCGKKFIQHSSMATHMKLNHMAKTLACVHCDKKYARQVDLNIHLLSHTGDKPFACQLCPTRFIRQANLNKHINHFHNDSTNVKKPKIRRDKTDKVPEDTINNKKYMETPASACDKKPEL